MTKLLTSSDVPVHLKKFYVTFGFSQPNQNCYFIIEAESYEMADLIAKSMFGRNWSMLYTEAQWTDYLTGKTQAEEFNLQELTLYNTALKASLDDPVITACQHKTQGMYTHDQIAWQTCDNCLGNFCAYHHKRHKPCVNTRAFGKKILTRQYGKCSFCGNQTRTPLVIICDDCDEKHESA